MTIYAFTDIGYLPDYVNISENVHGGVIVTVRQMIGRWHEDHEVVVARIPLTMTEARKMSDALKKVFDQGDYVPLGFSPVTGSNEGK